METIYNLSPQRSRFMYSLSSRLRPSLSLSSSSSVKVVSFLCARAQSETAASKKSARVVSRNGVKASEAALLKESWLASLSCPLPQSYSGRVVEDLNRKEPDSDWIIGIDPDLSGALAVLKPADSDCSAQVFDSPHLKVMVGKRIRKRLDAKSIVQLLRSLNAPPGTTAYIEQSIPYPQDGKQGWWSGGFGYGIWIGILVASGFTVVPVPSLMWKNEFQLAGGTSTKDDSRRLASELFPSLNSQLQRKKDHGRAEALLIAAYGKGLKISNKSIVVEELVC